MALFYIGATILALLAVLFVVWPLLRNQSSLRGAGREETNIALYDNHLSELDRSLENGSISAEQHESLKQELARNLLEDSQALQTEGPDSASEKTSDEKSNKDNTFSKKGIFALVSIVTIVVAGAVYTQLGSYDSWQIKSLLDQRTALQSQYLQTADATLPVKITALNQRLLDRLSASLGNEADQSDLQLRVLYARTLAGVRRTDDAISQYQKILVLEPESTQIMAELVQLLFVKAGNQIIPIIDSLLGQILKREPNNPIALSLAGVGAFQAGQYVDAIAFWERSLQFQQAGTANSRALQAGIEKARQHLEEAGGVEKNAGKEDDAVEGGSDISLSASLNINVALADGVKAEPQDTVFVYARAWQGARIPLAIQRLQVKDLPVNVTLTNAMSMAPGMNLTSAEELEVVARVSKSGSPVPQAGDWQASYGPVTLQSTVDQQSQVYELLIDQAVQ